VAVVVDMIISMHGALVQAAPVMGQGKAVEHQTAAQFNQLPAEQTAAAVVVVAHILLPTPQLQGVRELL
jgi:hypothetical protein